MKVTKQQMRRERSRLCVAALRMARQCRRIIQGCLREEEWCDADAEFYAIIISGVRRILRNPRK